MNSARILIVEDERITAKDIEATLVRAGYVVPALAASGAEAVALAETHHPDLVLMDIVLPGDLDGIQAAQIIQDRWAIPIIYLTAYSDAPMVERARATAPIGYVAKPFSERDLLTTVEISLHQYLTARQRANTLLQSSEEQYRLLFNAMLDGIALHEIICDRNGKPCDYRFLEINPAFETLTGLRARDTIGKTAREALPGIESFWIETYGKVALTGESIRFENYSGPLQKHFEVVAFCPRPGQFVTVFQDVTERVRAEESVRQSLARAERSERTLLALSQAAQAVQQALTPEEVYRAIGDEVVKLGYHATAYHLSNNATHLSIAYVTYASDLIHQAEKLAGISLKDFRIRLTPGDVIQQAIAERRAVFYEGRAIERFVAAILPGWLHPLAGQLVAMFGLRKGIIAPLATNGNVIGILAITGDDLSEADVPAMSAFANQAAIALEKARLYSQAQHEIAERRRAEESLRASETRYRNLFENSPISIWEEDFSAVKQQIEDLRLHGVTDFRTYLTRHPETVAEWARLVKVVDVNQAAIKLLRARGKEDLVKSLGDLLDEASVEYFKEELIYITENKSEFSLERPSQTLDGQPLVISLNWLSALESRSGFSDVIVSAIDVTERRQAEAALRENEARFRSITEASPDGLSVSRIADGQILYANERLAQMLGVPTSELMGRRAPEFYVHPEDRQTFLEAIARDGWVDNFEVQARRTDGSLFWALVSARPGMFEGAAALYVGVRDITDRKQAEQALREKEEYSQSLLRLSRRLEGAHTYAEVLDAALEEVGAIIGYQALWVYLFTEDRKYADALLLTGGSLPGAEPPRLTIQGDRMLEEIAEGKGIVIVEDAQTDERTNKEIVARLGNRTLVNIPIVLFDKHLGSVGTGTFGDQGVRIPTPSEQAYLSAMASHLAVSLDRIHSLIERRRAEEERRKLSHAVEQSPVSVVITDTAGRIEYVNPKFTQLTGYTAEEAIGQNPRILKSGETPREEYERLWKTITGGGEWRGELRNKKKSGELYWELASISPIFNAEGVITHFLAVKEDITGRKQRERELESIAAVSAALRVAHTRADMPPIILDQLLDLLQVGGAALAIRDPASDETIIELGRGGWEAWTGIRLAPGEGVSGYVIANGQTYVSDDIVGDPHMTHPGLTGTLRAIACAPLSTHEQTIGALWIGREHGIAPREVRLLTTIADIAANAIHRATQHEQTKRALHRLTILHEIDVAISSSLDLHLTLRMLVSQITRHLNVDAAAVLLLEAHNHQLQFAAASGFRTPGIEHASLRLGEGYAGRVALQRRPLFVADIRQTGELFVRTLATSEGFIAYYGIPLMVKGQVKGVLEIFQRASLASEQEWLEFMETLAAQATIAIDNATLFDGLQRSNIELQLAYDTTIEGWSKALDLRDKETEGHSLRVTKMTERLAQALGMSETELVHIRRGALLHDIGKMGVPDSILLKPGKLTEEEWAVMRRHPQLAHDLLTPIAFLRPALDIPYCHHEMWDGAGYPRGLKSEAIPLAARLFAVADVYDALTSDRPYRPALSKDAALNYIREQSGRHFDPQAVKAFLKVV